MFKAKHKAGFWFVFSRAKKPNVNLKLIFFRTAKTLSGGNPVSDPLIPTVPPYVKSGVFRTVIESRTPMSLLNVTGDTW